MNRLCEPHLWSTPSLAPSSATHSHNQRDGRSAFEGRGGASPHRQGGQSCDEGKRLLPWEESHRKVNIAMEGGQKKETRGRTFRLPIPTARPGIRPQLRTAPKAIAARYFQLLIGHAMVAPFLKKRWGWTDSGRCWWCEKSR